MVRLEQADFVDRNNFADFLNRTGRLDCAAEIGVHRGEFARLFLANWRGNSYYGIDCWSIPEGYEDQASTLSKSNGNRHRDYMEAYRIVSRYGNTTLITSLSENAAKEFNDDVFDFVYVDADHRYEQVRNDLYLWWPKVKPGGILAGHDFLCHGIDVAAHAGVQKAVIEFAEEFDLTIHLVTETLCQPWSFFIEKPV